MRSDFSCMDDSIGAGNAPGCLQSQTDWRSSGDKSFRLQSFREVLKAKMTNLSLVKWCVHYGSVLCFARVTKV